MYVAFEGFQPGLMSKYGPKRGLLAENFEFASFSQPTHRQHRRGGIAVQCLSGIPLQNRLTKTVKRDETNSLTKDLKHGLLKIFWQNPITNKPRDFKHFRQPHRLVFCFPTPTPPTANVLHSFPLVSYHPKWLHNAATRVVP